MIKKHKISSSFYYSGSEEIISGSNLLWSSASNYTINNFVYDVDDSLFEETNKYYARFWIRKYDDYSGSFTVAFTSSLGYFTSSHVIESGSDFTMSYAYVYDKSWWGTGSISGSMITQSIYDPNYNYFDFDITNEYSESIAAGYVTHSVDFYISSSSPDVSYSLFSYGTFSKYYPVIIEKYDIKSTGSLPEVNEYTSSNYNEYFLTATNNKEYYNSQSYNISMSCYPKYYQQSFDNWSIFTDSDWTFRHTELYYRIKEYYKDYQTIIHDFDEEFQWIKWDSTCNYIPINFDSLEEGYYKIDIYDKDNDTYYYDLFIVRVDK